MLNRIRFVQACIVGAVLLGGTALISTDAFAQCCQGGGPTGANAFTDGLATSASWPADPWEWPADSTLPLKAAPAVPFWWTHGEIEAGGRDFLNDPTVGGSIYGNTTNGGVYGISNNTVANKGSGLANGSGNYVPLGQNSLAKYYEYSIVAPGAFGGGHVATGTSDGLYQIDLWANNIGSNFQGFSDQSYMLTASKAGEQYFTFIWDQTPHVYSTSAQTFYQGVGSNNLTLPAGLAADPLSHISAPSYSPTSTQTLGPNGKAIGYVPWTVGVNQNAGGSTILPTPNYSGGSRLPFPGIQPNGGIIPYLYGTDLGIQRNTAAVSYRATDPWMSWDAGADYSYMTRTGTQAAGIVEMNGFMPTQVPAPVDDSTQNFGAKGEYIGTSLWGQKFTVKVAYNGSVYTDNISNYTVQNPFYPNAATTVAGSPTAGGAGTIPSTGTCIGYGWWTATPPAAGSISGKVTTPATAPSAGTANCGSAQMSTWPSNQANGFSETTTADLPFQSRYISTTSYTIMTQNAAFLPMTNNPNAVASPNGALWSSTAALPMQSLGGDIHEIVSNNVITTQITPTLTSKLSYRLYDFDNQTPQIVFPCWVSYDGTGGTFQTNTPPSSTGGTKTYSLTPSCAMANPAGLPKGWSAATSGYENTISSLSIGYVKQDAGAELNWRPTREWNVNAAYGYERYDYTEADAGATNENSVKVSVDWKPMSWLTARASGYYSERTAENYTYTANVAAIQFPTLPAYTPNTSFQYSNAYQQFFLDNRNRTKADFLLDIVVLPGVTISPSVKYKDDFYPLNTNTNAPAGALAEGLSDQKSIGAGVDVGWVVTPTLSIVASYYYEYYHQLLYSGTGTGAPTAANLQLVTTTDNEFVNTVTAAVRWAAIPNTLDFDARYSYSFSVDEQTCVTAASCTTGPGVNFTSFPNVTGNFQRVDFTATYRFDPDWVRQMGFKGDVLARLRYTWESNSVNNWQNDALASFTDIPGMANAIWMAYDNPNYNVQMLALSLIARW
jgi:hypothetical protein